MNALVNKSNALLNLHKFEECILFADKLLDIDPKNMNAKV